jgi:hypothetical protein
MIRKVYELRFATIYIDERSSGDSRALARNIKRISQ